MPADKSLDERMAAPRAHIHFNSEAVRGRRLGGGQPLALFVPYVYRGNQPWTPTPKQRARIEAEARKLNNREDVLNAYAALYEQGLTVSQAATHLDMSYKALDQALYRASRRGDARARRNAVPR